MGWVLVNSRSGSFSVGYAHKTVYTGVYADDGYMRTAGEVYIEYGSGRVRVAGENTPGVSYRAMVTASGSTTHSYTGGSIAISSVTLWNRVGQGGIDVDMNWSVRIEKYLPDYTVTFKDWNGTTLKTQTVTQGGSASAPASPTRVGHTFAGWSGSYTNVTSNRTITATYTVINYAVTFNNWDGTRIGSIQQVPYGGSATAPSAPSRTGYTFSGWSGTYTNVTSARTITATFTINSYTVAFNNWNGTNIVTRTVNHGSNASPPSNPTRTGYTFSSWSGTYTNVTSNQTVTAVFTINTYSVNFKNWNGTNIVTRTVNYGANATPPANPTRTGYTFSSWSGTYTNVTSNRDITATFTINSYVVTFKDWNGGTLKTETVNYGSGATAPTSPTRAGYSFAGWDRSYNSITSTTTVTATYTILTYTVTFKDWDNTTLKSETVNHGSDATAPANPSRTGYTFDGWDKGFTNVTSNLTVNAVYTYIPQPALTPASITYAAEVKGGESLNISWGLSSRATRYHLERSINGAGYTQIYSGTARVYDDAITKGWLTVQYRVRGYNEDGYSPYRTGTNTATVINFPDIFENVNGTYVAFEGSWENVNGTWIETDSIWENINGTWIEV